jgi:hypothetical protein
MIGACKSHVTTALIAAGLTVKQVLAEARTAEKHKTLPRAWLDAKYEDVVRSPQRVARTTVGNVPAYRWQTHTRQLNLVVRIEDAALSVLETMYEEFLRQLGAGLNDSAGNFIRISFGRVEWYELEGLGADSAGVGVLVKFDGGVYHDQASPGFRTVTVEAGAMLPA